MRNIGYVENQEVTDQDLRITSNCGFVMDGSTNTAVLATLAGYMEKDNIRVNGHRSYSKESLNSFLSYILNDPRCAPKDFNLDINYLNHSDDAKNIMTDPTVNTIIAFSGGIDSVAGLLLAMDRSRVVSPLWVGFGQKNEQQELDTVNDVLSLLNMKPNIVRLDLKDYVDKGWERWGNGIIPGRNYLFAAIAASLISSNNPGNLEIDICAHKEEITPVNTDKSRQFFETSSKIFTAAYNRPIEVTTPFFDITKPEIISYWYRHWINKYNIKPEDTVSCYLGTNCGLCKSCVNRAVAFTCANVPVESFQVNPFSDTEGLIQTSYIDRFDSLDMDRKLDFLYALSLHESYIPKSMRSFVKDKSHSYKSAIKGRQRTISTANI